MAKVSWEYKSEYGTAYSQAVTHPSTNAAQCCLTSVRGGEGFFQVREGGGERFFKVNRGGEGFFKVEIERPDQTFLSSIAWSIN